MDQPYKIVRYHRGFAQRRLEVLSVTSVELDQRGADGCREQLVAHDGVHQLLRARRGLGVSEQQPVPLLRRGGNLRREPLRQLELLLDAGGLGLSAEEVLRERDLDELGHHFAELLSSRARSSGAATAGVSSASMTCSAASGR